MLTGRHFTGILVGMSTAKHPLSRRDFLKLASIGIGGLALRPLARPINHLEKLGVAAFQPDFPIAERLGRNCIDGAVNIMSRPDVGSSVVKTVYEDTVLPWLREVNADNFDFNRINQRWVETPDGYAYASYLQPCKNTPNQPLTEIPAGQQGFWAEVTVPYVEMALDTPTPISEWSKNRASVGQTPRLYYSQVTWIDQIKTSEATGNILYRVNEKYGNPGDLFWALGSAFRPLTNDDVAPIHPEVDPAIKKVVVNLTYQTLSCFEAQNEVYYCRVSTGAKYNAAGQAVDAWSTPPGTFSVSWKLISVRMGNSATSGSYETPCIPWTSFFAIGGVSIHSTFWHNDFGAPRSHGCVNCKPQDANWIFRWLLPNVSLEQSSVEIPWPGGTQIVVEERLW
jgi:lipoprotein-anchoring transpeptidase ErfK/SrfK